MPELKRVVIDYPVVFFSTKTEETEVEGKPQDNSCWGCGDGDKNPAGAPTLCITGEEVAMEFCPLCATKILERILRLYIRAFHGKEPHWPIRQAKKLDENTDPMEVGGE